MFANDNNLGENDGFVTFIECLSCFVGFFLAVNIVITDKTQNIFLALNIVRTNKTKNNFSSNKYINN